MLAVLFVRLAVSAKTTSELTLQKSSFLDSRFSSSGLRSFMFDVSVPIKMLECLVQNTTSAGGILHAVGCHVVIDGTIFKGLSVWSAIVTEGEGTCPDLDPSDMRQSGEITCTLVTTAGRLKCTDAWFEDLQATDPGGAIRVLKGSEGLELHHSNFTNCTTSAGWGGAFYYEDGPFGALILASCSFIRCTCNYSSVHTVPEMEWHVWHDCWFIENTITDSGKDIGNVQCGGSGLELQGVKDLTLLRCHFVRTNRSQGGSGGAYAMHTMGGSLTLENCTFSKTWAMNGGCIAISVECSSLVVLGCSAVEQQQQNYRAVCSTSRRVIQR